MRSRSISRPSYFFVCRFIAFFLPCVYITRYLVTLNSYVIVLSVLACYRFLFQWTLLCRISLVYSPLLGVCLCTSLYLIESPRVTYCSRFHMHFLSLYLSIYLFMFIILLLIVFVYLFFWHNLHLSRARCISADPTHSSKCVYSMLSVGLCDFSSTSALLLDMGEPTHVTPVFGVWCPMLAQHRGLLLQMSTHISMSVVCNWT